MRRAGGVLCIMEMNPQSAVFQRIFGNPFAYTAFKSTEPWLQVRSGVGSGVGAGARGRGREGNGWQAGGPTAGGPPAHVVLGPLLATTVYFLCT